MSTHEKENFFQTYDWVEEWNQLPWAHEDPTLFLPELCSIRKPGKALDIGCGSGTDSVYLATQGWDVTSLDFMPKALEFTQKRAEAAGATVTPVEADVTEWEPPHAYDLVLDHGLLHNMDPVRHAPYRERLMRAVGEQADFVLLHWHPLYPGQEHGQVGPRRVVRDEIKKFFAPEFQERWFAIEDMEELNDYVGGGMSQAYYWFQRNKSYNDPAELLQQIRDTLAKHDVDFSAKLADAGSGQVDGELSNGLLARVVGPGRFGVSPVLLEADQAGAMVADLAKRANANVNEVENLIRIFVSEDQAGICNGPTPKCTECGVVFCKRLRQR